MLARGHIADSKSTVPVREVAIIIPTFNGAKYWASLQQSLNSQGIKKDQILVVDSSSTDNTRALVEASGYRLRSIPAESFRHGATRKLASTWVPWARFIVYLTQDSIPENSKSIQTLLEAFVDPQVGAAYGRQIPRANAGLIEQHARLFNYPPGSELRTYDSRKHLGIRAAFFSNSFAAYRREALEEVGGFPTHTIVSEDVQVAALMLRAGWKTKYQASARTIHSHRLSLKEEFSRYFDIGVHHSREQWLLKEFGKRQGEGLAFVRSELDFLLKRRRTLIPLAILRNINKYISYHLGLQERHLSVRTKALLSGQTVYWRDEQADAARSNSVDSTQVEQKAAFRKSG